MQALHVILVSLPWVALTIDAFRRTILNFANPRDCPPWKLLIGSLADVSTGMHCEASVVPGPSDPSPTTASALSDDDLRSIFIHLESAELLRTAALVCKHWSELARSSAVWQPRMSSMSATGIARLKLVTESAAKGIPLHQMYSIYNRIYGPWNLLACPNFAPEQQGLVTVPPQMPWKTTEEGGDTSWAVETMDVDYFGMDQASTSTVPLPLAERNQQFPAGTPIGAGTRLRSVTSSHEWLALMQEVDLVGQCQSAGLSPTQAQAFLNGAPLLEFSVYVGARWDQAAQMNMLVVLDDGKRPLPNYTGGSGEDMFPWEEQEGTLAFQKVVENDIPNRSNWQHWTALFQGYSAGVRRAIVVLRGRDHNSWAGHFGSKFAAPQLRFRPDAIEMQIGSMKFPITNKGGKNC
eukprot:CAMPEP_0206142546 /NCGR_PEP_ID=MMETSP1473-20131121/17325_1 /ASSEMBLY_ACC=CAM_ASM_001109 /TAXON_ID=1461547 /ORGANISM="Stichococcus sp, Strain RCC1054" /LENGTH=406 /DNA_ID=CAMNT_0053537585 /DNA_START=167 /DNA_END=1387 /DNA_ORIENTATION=+